MTPRTKATPASTRVAFLLETTDAPRFTDTIDAAATDLASRLRTRSREVAIH